MTTTTTTTAPRRSLAKERDENAVDTSQQSTAGAFGLPRIVTTVPMNLFNSINPFATTDGTKSSDTKDNEAGAQQSSNLLFKRPALITLLGGGRTQSSGSNGQNQSAAAATTTTTTTSQGALNEEDEDVSRLRQRSTTVMFAEPELTDSDNNSRDESVSDGARRQRRKTRPKTAFSICHPPPASLTRHKLHRRPRSLLQLHRLSADSRPVPAFEVIPSANFSVRLVKSITKVYKAKHGLCAHDFVILRAEKYYTQEHEEEQAEQDIVALICRGRGGEGAGNGKAKICMANGQEWEAYSHASSGYEFYTTDDHGLAVTVRWVPKKNKENSRSEQKRFNFSTIAQNSRRHPVIATLTNAELDIYNTYKVPDPAITTPLSTPKNSDGFLSQAMENDDDALGHDECATDERLRSIITITAIWVAFQEGWSPYYKSEDKDGSGTLKGTSPRKDGVESPANTPPGSPAQYALDKRASLRSVGSDIMRRSSLLSSKTLRANRNSTLSVDSITSTDTATGAPSSRPPSIKHSRTRSDSTSTVLVHRAASNRRRNNQQATWRPDLLDAQHAVPEASREDLSRVPSSKSKRRSDVDGLGSPLGKKTPLRPVQSQESDDSDDGGSEHSQSTKTGDKRESSATTNTSSSEHGESSKRAPPELPAKKKASPIPKKTNRWRKLLCIR